MDSRRRSEIAKRVEAHKRRVHATRERRAQALRHRQHTAALAASASFDAPVVRALTRMRVSTHAADGSLEAAGIALMLLGVASAALLGLVLRLNKLRGWA